MNIKERLKHLAIISAKDIQCGKTQALVGAAKELGAIFLTATHKEAKFIQNKYKIDARSVEINLEGFVGPFIFDHRAVEYILERAYVKINSLEKENENLKNEQEELVKRLEKKIDKMESDFSYIKFHYSCMKTLNQHLTQQIEELTKAPEEK
jgi:hypothetical protein